MVPFSGRSFGPILLAAVLLLVGMSSSASAQSSVGFLGGASIDPEQGFVGVFWESPDLGGRFRLRPGLDGGFGNDLRLATINIDLVYLIPLGNGAWNFTTGGGPAIVLTRLSNDVIDYGTNVGAGFSYLFGFAHDSGFFTEVRVGGGDSPNLKFGAGWRLKID